MRLIAIMTPTAIKTKIMEEISTSLFSSLVGGSFRIRLGPEPSSSLDNPSSWLKRALPLSSALTSSNGTDDGRLEGEKEILGNGVGISEGYCVGCCDGATEG